MSGIKWTSSGTPTPLVDTAKGAASPQQQVSPVTPSSPSGGQSGPDIRQASSVSQLTDGAVIAAIVTARATGGDTMLHAEIGNFRMSTSSQLPVGSHVVLEVESFDDVIIARIISLNGEKLASPPSVTLLPIISATKAPVEGYGGGNLLTPTEIKTGLQNLTAALGNAAENSLSSENKMTAGAQQQSPRPPTAPISPQTSGATLKYGNTSVPIPSIGPQGSIPASGQTQLSGAAAYAHTNSPGPKTIPSLQARGGDMETTTVKVQAPPPLSATVSPPPDAQPALVKAIIQRPPLSQMIELASGPKNIQQGSALTLIVSPSSGKESTHIIQGTSSIGTIIAVSGTAKTLGGSAMSTLHVQTTAFGTLSYASASPPLVGSHVNLTALEELQPFPLSSAPLASSAFKTPHLPIMIEWENLRSALNIMLAQDPAQALSLLNRRVPAPNNQLGASLLFFLSAINGGSIDKWLGQNFRLTLEKAGQQALLSNLEDEFSTLVRINSETGGNDWKNLTFPFYDGHALRQIKMFYRHRNKNPQGEGDESTRFVIELDLSKSGPVQLDGLFNKARFDLVFRSQLPLPEELRQHVLSIFNDNLEITGIQGNLVFQRTVPFPVHPTEEWENTEHDIFDA